MLAVPTMAMVGGVFMVRTFACWIITPSSWAVTRISTTGRSEHWRTRSATSPRVRMMSMPWCLAADQGGISL